MKEYKEQLIKDLYDSNVQADITVEELADDIIDDYKHLVIEPILKRQKELHNELVEIKNQNRNKKINLKDAYTKSICIRLNEIGRILDLLNYTYFEDNENIDINTLDIS